MCMYTVSQKSSPVEFLSLLSQMLTDFNLVTLQLKQFATSDLFLSLYRKTRQILYAFNAKDQE